MISTKMTDSCLWGLLYDAMQYSMVNEPKVAEILDVSLSSMKTVMTIHCQTRGRVTGVMIDLPLTPQDKII